MSRKLAFFVLYLVQDAGPRATAVSKKSRNGSVFQIQAGPWRPGTAQRDRTPLCDQGKLLPELYVLGAKKASTTSFASDLMEAGIDSVAGHQKEWHFYDSRMDWRNAGDPSSLMKEYRRWLDELPPCPRTRVQGDPFKQTVLADFTPENMLMVPLPVESSVRGPLPPWAYRGESAKFQVDDDKVNLPKVLMMFYGQRASSLVFTILLREPLHRMQSGWYAFRSGSSGKSQWECSASFSCALKDRLELVEQQPPTYRNAVFSSMYGLQVTEWLMHFEATQFVFVPYKIYVTGEKDSICFALAKRLKFAMQCDSLEKPASFKWHTTHPSLDKDITSELLLRWREFLKPDEDLLLAKLTSASKEGAHLAGYGGPAGSKDNITTWLQRGW